MSSCVSGGFISAISRHSERKYRHLDAHTGKYPQPFSNGLCAMIIDDYWCYVDTTGAVVFHDNWTHVTTFENGVAWVAHDGKYAKIDMYGNYLSEYSQGYDYVTLSSFSMRSNGITLSIEDNGRVYRDANGNVIASGDWSNAWEFNDGYAFVLKDGKWGVINDEGEQVLPHEYSGGNYGEGYFVLIKDGVTMIYDEEMNRLFESIPPFSHAEGGGILFRPRA